MSSELFEILLYIYIKTRVVTWNSYDDDVGILWNDWYKKCQDSI
jgi:hypothetical protein